MSFKKFAVPLLFTFTFLGVLYFGTKGMRNFPFPLVKKPYLIEEQLYEGVTVVEGLHTLPIGKYKILAVSDENKWTMHRERCLFYILVEESDSGERVQIETFQPPGEMKKYLTSSEVTVKRQGVLEFVVP